MIKRVFWLGVGIAVGVVVVRKLTKTAESYTPHGIAASAQQSAVGLLDSVREFMADVRDNMAEREDQINAALAENAEYGDLTADDLGHLEDPYHLQEGDTER
jgi:hypothetical protein